MNFSKIYALGLRHIYLISNSLPRILDLIYWPTVQIFLWGFISKFFTLSSSYYNNTVGVILSAAILYDILRKISPNSDLNFDLKSENKLSLKSDNSNFNLLWIGTWIKKVDMNKITMIDKFKALSNDWIFKKIIIAIISSAIIAGAAIKDM